MRPPSYLVLALLVSASLGAVEAQPLPFDGVPWVGYNVGTSDFPGNPAPYEVLLQTIVAADLDGDGQRDLVVAGYNPIAPNTDDRADSGFDILFGRGDGTYGEPVRYIFTTKGVYDVVVGDFDEDGDPDLAMPDSGPSPYQDGDTVVLFLNDGTGAFSHAGAFPVEEVPTTLATGDFNNDGHLDLVANSAPWNGEYVSVLLGTGTGSFETSQPVFVGRRPTDVAAGDFNGDGYDELVVSGLGNLLILENDGTGAFGAPVDLSGSDSREPVVGLTAVADLNGDGELDLVSGVDAPVFHEFSDLAVRLGQGDGTFAEPVYYDLYAYGTTPEAIEPVDLDGDGDLDLVMCDWSGGTGDGLFSLFNDGAGGLGGLHHVPAGHGTEDLTVGDFDGDGDPDVATADRMSLAVTVHDNPGDGRFPILPIIPTGAGGNVRMVAGDVDNDGDLDVFTSNEAAGSAGALVKNNGDGTFAPGVLYDHAPGEINRGVARAKLRDLDGDGYLDLLYNDAHTEQETGYDFWVGLNDGTGTFGPLVEHDQNTCGNGDVDAFDLDNDGDLDVVNLEELNCAGTDNGRRLFINLNNGDATFAPPLIEQISQAPRDLAAGDLNNDGNVDLVTAHWAPYGFYDVLNVHLGNGDGTFQDEQVYRVGQGPMALVVADLDGDGHLDIASANSGTYEGATDQETMSILWGKGTDAPTFEPAEVYYAPYAPSLLGTTGITAGDVDGDGDLDLMLTTAANAIAMYYNEGGRSFDFRHRLGTMWSAREPIFADFTGDGRPDVITMARSVLGDVGENEGFVLLPGLESLPTGEEEGPLTEAPDGYALSAGYPNPFSAHARFVLAVAEAQHVEVAVFDALGRRVAVIHDGLLPAGSTYEFVLEAAGWPSGVYIVRASGERSTATRRVTLTR